MVPFALQSVNSNSQPLECKAGALSVELWFSEECSSRLDYAEKLLEATTMHH